MDGAFEVIDEILERYPRAPGARRAAHDFGVTDDDSLLHGL